MNPRCRDGATRRSTVSRRNYNVAIGRVEIQSRPLIRVVPCPPVLFLGVGGGQWGMSEERKSECTGVDAGTAEPPPSPDGRRVPSIPAPSGARTLASSRGRASGEVAEGGKGGPLVHRFNLDLSGRPAAVFNMLLRIERAKLRGGKRKLSARDLAKVILENYLMANEEQIFAHLEAAAEVERLAAGVGARRSSTPRRHRSSPPRSVRDAGDRSR